MQRDRVLPRRLACGSQSLATRPKAEMLTGPLCKDVALREKDIVLMDNIAFALRGDTLVVGEHYPTRRRILTWVQGCTPF